jgi:hypothetical protein
MKFKSRNIKCVDCQEYFVFGGKQQKIFFKKGLDTPKRCRQCRELRKQQLASKSNEPQRPRREGSVPSDFRDTARWQRGSEGRTAIYTRSFDCVKDGKTTVFRYTVSIETADGACLLTVKRPVDLSGTGIEQDRNYFIAPGGEESDNVMLFRGLNAAIENAEIHFKKHCGRFRHVAPRSIHRFRNFLS